MIHLAVTHTSITDETCFTLLRFFKNDTASAVPACILRKSSLVVASNFLATTQCHLGANFQKKKEK